VGRGGVRVRKRDVHAEGCEFDSSKARHNTAVAHGTSHLTACLQPVILVIIYVQLWSSYDRI
jgi:hypothetical protein